MLSVPQRIEALREQMQAHALDAWLVYTADPHLSEYLPAHWSQREYLSGFSGSAAYMAVTQDKAALWTDSRYWVQAEAQLQGSGIELMKLGAQGTPSLDEWLKEQLIATQTVGVNGLALSVAQALALEESLGQAELELIVAHGRHCHRQLFMSMMLSMPVCRVKRKSTKFVRRCERWKVMCI